MGKGIWLLYMGANNPKHVEENIAVGQTRLPEKKELKKMVEYFNAI